MKRFHLPAFLVLLLFAVSPAVHGGELEGRWIGQSLVTTDGKNADEFAKSIAWVFSGDEFTYASGDKATHGKATLVPTITPKTIDAHATMGDGPEIELQGIYKVDGETLTVCYAREARPKEFKGGEGQMLIVLKKQAK